MIEFIGGKFAEINPAYVLVDVNGLGYLVQISLNTYTDINGQESGRLITHYAVSVDVRSGESKHQLFGFSTQLERQLFRLLISVSGISSSIAHMVLSAFKPQEFQSIVLNGDSRTLTTVKGVGPKVAQKIVAELREKVAKSEHFDEISQPSGNSMRQEALSALVALGFDRAKSVKVLNAVVKDEAPATVEELIKKALKQL
ncbi:MAG: Holliday junction branch migration protein RuvA [Salibacteraceae bacterium]|jgi:holliday junction DNA helicase RuvA|nr:Holliday junction branch migration protein RuvA [Salibacteraceae bacterium]MDP4933242.1 Holliday junction branch migration protein RuvA [Salibacteraceae bacterium]